MWNLTWSSAPAWLCPRPGGPAPHSTSSPTLQPPLGATPPSCPQGPSSRPRHSLLKEVAPPEVWASIPPPSRQTGGTQRPAQGLVLASVESEVPAPPPEASAEVAAELPKAEASAAVSPAVKEEPWTCRSVSTSISGDIRDIFNLTSDEESDNEMEAPSYLPILEPVIENLGSHIDTADLTLQSPLLISTTPKDGDKSV